MRHILKTIPFPRCARRSGPKDRRDDTQSDPQCQTLPVMAGLVPAIHAFNLRKDVDARHKAGHDEEGMSSRPQRSGGNPTMRTLLPKGRGVGPPQSNLRAW